MRNALFAASFLALAGSAAAQDSGLSVDLTSVAFDSPTPAGATVLFEAAASGGTAPYVYAWDLDGDGQIDRRSEAAQIEVSFPQDGELIVSVQVTDSTAAPLSGMDSRAVSVRGPQLLAEAAGLPTQLSGNGNSDGQLDPGESWQQLVRFVNTGDEALPVGYALLAQSPSPETPLVTTLKKSIATITLPALDVGEEFTINVFFFVPRDAACGSRIAYDYVAAVNATSANFVRQTVFDGTVPADCSPRTSFPMIGTPPPGFPPQGFRPGLYFNSERPGNGLATFVYGTGDMGRTTFGGVWYTALPDRTPVWYTLQGNLFGGRGVLPLLQFSNAAAPEGFEPISEQVGESWIWQIDGKNLIFAWQFDDGRFGVELMAPIDQPLGHPNHTQTWFDPNETGWGLAIETPAMISASHINGTPFEFFGAFVYDDSGAPRWTTGAIPSTNGGTVELTAHRSHCPACPWITDWTSENETAGSLQIDYDIPTNETLGTISTEIELPEAFGGQWNRSGARIEPIATPMPTPVF